jgi:hypothetical protein
MINTTDVKDHETLMEQIIVYLNVLGDSQA